MALLKLSYYPDITQKQDENDVRNAVIVFGDALGAQLTADLGRDVSVETLPVMSVAEQYRDILAGGHHIALMKPVAYVFAHRNRPAIQPACVAHRPIDGKVGTDYFAQIYARRELGITTLAELAQDDPRMTPEALVQLVDLQLAQNTPVAPETMALLETMQFEFRGQPVVADLMRARVGAMAQAGTFEKALLLLPEAEALLPEEKALALRSDVVRAVSSGADDMMFLDVAFRPMGRDVAPNVQNAVAARLLDLGFPERASDVVSGPAIGSVMAERRYLRATAAMDMDDPETAAAQLAGVSTPRARTILGLDPATGPEAVAAGNDAAWREGDWATLASSEDTLLQEAAALVQEDVNAIPDSQTPLASGRALIEDAARTRATIDTLMSRFAPPS